jgi:hypothetical protein
MSKQKDPVNGAFLCVHALSPTRICLPLAALIRHSTSPSVRWTFLIAARPLRGRPCTTPREDMHTERSQ